MSVNAMKAAKLSEVIAERPDIPVICLAPSRFMYATGARVEWLLDPWEAQGSAYDAERYVGLDYERVYSNEDDAVEDVSEWLFENWWDCAIRHGMHESCRGEAPDDVLTEFCGYEYSYPGNSIANMCDDVARAIVRDMPWHEYVSIDCY